MSSPDATNIPTSWYVCKRKFVSTSFAIGPGSSSFASTNLKVHLRAKGITDLYAMQWALSQVPAST
jgi:hypothetical protein